MFCIERGSRSSVESLPSFRNGAPMCTTKPINASLSLPQFVAICRYDLNTRGYAQAEDVFIEAAAKQYLSISVNEKTMPSIPIRKQKVVARQHRTLMTLCFE